MSNIAEPMNLVSLTDHQQEIQNLASTLFNKYPNNFIIPCTTKKAPMFAHKSVNGVLPYDWTFIKTSNKVIFEPKGTVGIICKDILVIDIDCNSYIPIFEEQFTFMKECVSETTTKGKHYYFKRSQLCDTLNIYDASRCLSINGVPKAPIDVKTIASTGTGGIIVCAPSPKKKWIHSINDRDLFEIPDALTNYLKDNWYESKKPVKLTKDEKKKIVDEFVAKNKNKNTTDIDNELLKDLLDIIKEEKSNDYDDWIKVGWCIYNTLEGAEEGLKLWDEFSQASSKYVAGTCAEHWTKMTLKKNKNAYTIGSLRHWAKEINKSAYEAFLEKSTATFTRCALGNTDFDIANLVYQLYKNEFIIMSSPDGKIIECWRFNNHRWRNDGKIVLSKKILIEVSEIFSNEALKFHTQAKDPDLNDEEKVEAENLGLAYSLLSNKVKDAKNVRNIIEVLKTLMGENTLIFNKNKNENMNLIAFENGVYDIQNKKFRDGQPEDYITFSTGYDYTDIAIPEIQEKIAKTFWNCFENDELYQYLIDLMSYTICGRKNLEIYVILHGEGGRNGKGLLSYLMSLCLGDYYSEIKSSNLTDPKDTKGATDSELAQLQGVRFAVVTEPPKNAKLQVNRVKEYTGGDRIKARQLFQQAIQFKAQFLLLLQCNYMPANSCYKDKANEKRVRVIPYNLEFVDEPKEENERYCDTTLKDFLDNNTNYRQQFMLMLIENLHKIYENKKFNFVTPEIVKEASRKLLNTSNEFMLWFHDRFTKGDQTNFIKKTTVYNIYRGDHKNTKKTTFQKYMDENGFTLSTKDGYEVYRGWVLNPMHDDDMSEISEVSSNYPMFI
jgi:P4 family phage/plasmid primase-like protien